MYSSINSNFNYFFLIILIGRMCFEKRKENFKVEDNILTVQKWSTFHDPIA